MKLIINNASISTFNAWIGAINTKETIIENRKKQITTRNKTYNLKFEN